MISAGSRDSTCRCSIDNARQGKQNASFSATGGLDGYPDNRVYRGSLDRSRVCRDMQLVRLTRVNTELLTSVRLWRRIPHTVKNNAFEWMRRFLITASQIFAWCVITNRVGRESLALLQINLLRVSTVWRLRLLL